MVQRRTIRRRAGRRLTGGSKRVHHHRGAGNSDVIRSIEAVARRMRGSGWIRDVGIPAVRRVWRKIY